MQLDNWLYVSHLLLAAYILEFMELLPEIMNLEITQLIFVWD